MKKHCAYCNNVLISEYGYDNKPCCEQCVKKVTGEEK